MVRIFSGLAALAIGLLAANFVVGLAIGEFNRSYREALAALDEVSRLRKQKDVDLAAKDQAEAKYAAATAELAGPYSRKHLHMWLGLLGGLVTLLASSVTVTYFIGTSRWCREVCETYRLSSELIERSQRLKRSAFPWAVASMLIVIVMAGLGAAADPSANANASTYSISFVQPHYIAAMLGLLLIGWSFWMQYSCIAEN
ncbi:MAG TPA: hypothetical protein VMP01_27900, partial [Pirellulaceae bacterium]|nr:hypothetical protein [Pirellulaceae bacterium]